MNMRRRLGCLALWLGLIALWLGLLASMPKAQAMTGPGHCEMVKTADSRANSIAVEVQDQRFEPAVATGSRSGWRDCLPRPLERLRELDGGDIGFDPEDGSATLPGGFVATGRLLGTLVIWAGQESLLIGVLLDEPRRSRGTTQPRCRHFSAPAGAGSPVPSIGRRA